MLHHGICYCSRTAHGKATRPFEGTQKGTQRGRGCRTGPLQHLQNEFRRWRCRGYNLCPNINRLGRAQQRTGAITVTFKTPNNDPCEIFSPYLYTDVSLFQEGCSLSVTSTQNKQNKQAKNNNQKKRLLPNTSSEGSKENKASLKKERNVNLPCTVHANPSEI